MDDTVVTILYIVGTIVAIAIGALGKKKKKKAGSSNILKELFDESDEKIISQDEEIEISEDIQEEVEPIRVEITEKETIPPVTVSEIPVERPSVFDLTSIKADSDFTDMDEEESDIFNFVDKQIGDVEEEEEDINVLDDFDLKEAVIFSEILKRKEY